MYVLGRHVCVCVVNVHVFVCRYKCPCMCEGLEDMALLYHSHLYSIKYQVH